MKPLKIYQIKESAPRGLMFIPYSWLSDPVSMENYECIYEGGWIVNESISCELENIFEEFNIRHKPENYKGHSLSVSDIVELDGIKYYVDDIGFKKLSI